MRVFSHSLGSVRTLTLGIFTDWPQEAIQFTVYSFHFSSNKSYAKIKYTVGSEYLQVKVE